MIYSFLGILDEDLGFNIDAARLLALVAPGFFARLTEEQLLLIVD